MSKVAASEVLTIMRDFRFLGATLSVALLSACGTSAGALNPRTADSSARQSSGGFTVLHDFQGGPSDGSGPDDVLFGPNYALIGTTAAGGHIHPRDCKTTGCGTVYELNGSSEQLLYTFQPDPDGFHPVGGLLENYGVYYGVAQGGAYDDGMVFSLSNNPSGNWVETTLYSFKGPPTDGFDVSGIFYIDKHGAILGTTRMGGSGKACLFASSGCGTVFELRPPRGKGAWHESILHSFGGSPDGAGPNATAVRIDGSFYGTTEFGGASTRCPAVLGCGTIYKITPARGGGALERVAYSFNLNTPGTDGVSPSAIANGYDQKLYGTTFFGGGGGASTCEDEPNVEGCGTFYSFALGQSKNSHDTIIHAFSGPPDAEEPGEITGDGLYGFFGVSYAGGSTACGVSGCGTIFEMAHHGSSWTERIWHEFNGTDGKDPNGIVSAVGRFYGTTYSGGTAACSCGTLFELSTVEAAKGKLER
jgi:uncharacterized repeat protein (TIGR03803 family)